MSALRSVVSRRFDAIRASPLFDTRVMSARGDRREGRRVRRAVAPTAACCTRPPANCTRCSASIANSTTSSTSRRSGWVASSSRASSIPSRPRRWRRRRAWTPSITIRRSCDRPRCRPRRPSLHSVSSRSCTASSPAPNVDAFVEFTERENFFDRLAGGQSFIFVGSHLEFQDVGFNLGYLTRAAQRVGVDRLDTRTTLMIGRLLGYLEVMGLNVIDDILRKAANVLKTFPVSGGEAVNEGDITDEDLNRRVKGFRKRQNARTRSEFMNLMTSDHGHIVIEAGSGSRDAKDAHGFVVMEPFAPGTREDLYLAVACGRGDLPDLRRLRQPRGAEHRRVRSRDPSHRQSAARARHRRDDRRHGQPRPRGRGARTSRHCPLPDPDPVRELRDVAGGRARHRPSQPPSRPSWRKIVAASK